MILENRYELQTLLYSDTSISLHEGYDRLLNRPVAVEQLQTQLATDPQVVARFLDTARALAMVELPHVAALYDQGEVAGQPFLIFEAALPTTIATGAPLPSAQVVGLMQQLVETLTAARGRGGAVPAMTPETVRYAPDGRVQIMQTGLAAQVPVTGVMPALAALFLVALTGSQDGRGKTALAPSLMRVVERARANQYAQPEVLVHDLEAAERQATAQTVVVPPAQPAPPPHHQMAAQQQPAPAPHIVPPLAPVPSMAVDQAPVRPVPRRSWLGRGALLGLLAVVLIVSLLFLLRRPATGTANPPTTSTTQAARTGAAATTPQVSPTRSGGQPYTVSTASGRPLNIRQAPSIASPVIGTAAQGTRVQVFDTPVQADGYTWVHIQTGTVDGWGISEALKK